MAILYNCHTDGDQFRITKFDELGNPEASYLVSLDECTCPAGHRPHCRHRLMLPKFLERGHVNSHYFFDFDRGGWLTNDLPAPPAGVQVFGMDDLFGLHNAIADAVGEPEAKFKAPSVGSSVGSDVHVPSPPTFRRRV